MTIFRKSLLATAVTFSLVMTAKAENLIELYDLALKEDRAYQAAIASNKSVKVGEEIADALYLPNISFSADTFATDFNTNSAEIATQSDESFTSSSGSLNIAQPLYNRDISIGADISKGQSRKSDAELDASDQDLIIRLATAYFNVLAAEDTLGFAGADKKAIARQLDQAQQRFDVGLIAITAVHEAQASYDQSVATEIRAQNALDAAREALREIIGENDLSLDVLSDRLILEMPNPQSLEEWSSMAMAQNPNIQAAREAVDLALKNIELQRNGHYPTLNLLASGSVDETTGRAGGDSTTTSIGLNFELPLYAGGGVTAKTRQAQLDFEAAQYTLEQQERFVTRNVKDAFRAVESSISQVKAYDAVRVSSKSALDATEAGYEVGTRTIVDVLNSQRNYFLAQKDYADSRYKYVVSLLTLKQAAGALSRADLENVNQWLARR